ncbi:MAG: hypothetical protein E3J72_00525 [Planctomycetota bacterium]|nr:MAG: hypothetical protein E3J72_00525 [Planctomycetota bacterium]
MRLLSTLILAATLVVATTCAAAEKPAPAEKPDKPAPEEGSEEEVSPPETPIKKPPEPEKPEEAPKPDDEEDEITDAQRRGIIDGGGAETCDAALKALGEAAKSKDKDAIWKLLTSETRRDIAVEAATFKFRKMLDAEGGGIDFLGKKTSVKGLGAYPVARLLIDAMNGVLDCEWQSVMMRPGLLFMVGGFLTDADNLTRLAETVEKDGWRTDIYVRTPGGLDVHLWFVKEGGRWFFHSQGSGTPPDAEWELPDLVKPGRVDVKLDTPVDTVRTFVSARVAIDPVAIEKCMDSETRAEVRMQIAFRKAIADGTPSDQDNVYLPAFGLLWKELKDLPVEKYSARIRIPREVLEDSRLSAKKIESIGYNEISNDGKKAVVVVVDNNPPPPPRKQSIDLVKESDGWKIARPEPEDEEK